MSPRVAKVVLGVVALVAIAAFVVAGNWQRDRFRAKEAERAAIEAVKGRSPVALPRGGDWNALRYRRVFASGTWRGDAQILVDNRIVDGQAGFGVVTPLALDDGAIVLVDRGWVAAGAGASRVPKVSAPSGRAVVYGRIVLPPARYLELDKGAPQGPVWQNLDPRRVAASTGLPLLPIVLEQDPGPGPDGLVRKRADPTKGAETHRIYMWQWYAFAALTAVLWVYFTFRRPRAEKRR